MSKIYKTESGSFSEEELSVVVWVNPKHEKSKQTRSLETIISDRSPLPIAFPTSKLNSHPAWMKCPVAYSKQDVDRWLLSKEEKDVATKNKPILVPLPLAQEVLGWENFYVPTSFKEF
jgi:hypothetical protein